MGKGIKNITVETTEMYIPVGKEEQINIDIELSNGIHTSQPVGGLSYQVLDNGIAIVNSSGLVIPSSSISV